MKTRTNLFSSLNNGQKSMKNFTKLPYSRFSLEFLQILQEEGFISHWHLENYNPHTSKNEITVYFKNKNFLGSSQNRPFKITQISKKTQPSYLSLKSLWTYAATDKVLILSTNRGLITDRQGREFSLGGELLCRISY